MKKPIIFLHGLGHNHQFWDEFFPLFPSSFSVKYNLTTIDLPKIGEKNNFETYPYFLKKYLDKLKEKVILVGYSLGGLVSLEFAALYPDLVEKIVLISTPITNKKQHEKICNFLTEEKTLKRIKRLEGFLEKHKTIENEVSHVVGLDEEDLIKNHYFCQLPFCFSDILDHNWLSDVKKVFCPVLCLYGNKDKTIAYFESQSLYPLLKNVKIKEISGRHYLINDYPEEIAGEIVKFLNDPFLGFTP